ncbi:M42 family metallopeptidase [Enterococcus sp. LJL120]
MDLVEQLQALATTPGIAGNEKYISHFLKEQYTAYCDEIIYDNLGSIYALKKGSGASQLRVMVNAHMDELGFILKKINTNGTLTALALGQFNDKALLGTKVNLMTRSQKTFTGVILGQDQAGTALGKTGDVLLDFGFISEAEAATKEIMVGDMITLAADFFTSENQETWYAANWNGRLAVSQTIDILRALADVTLPFDLYVGCTVQEQVGTRGAQTAANLVQPDLAVMLDTQQAWDYQTDANDQQGVLGEGLLLTYYDPSVLPNRLLLSELRQLCDTEKIAYQNYYSLTGSDAGWINKLRTGCPTLLIGQALRNLDAGLQVARQTDYQAIAAALVAFLKALTPEKIIAYQEENR